MGEGTTAAQMYSNRAKAAGFEAELESGTWNARNQWVKGNTIAIEWEAQLRFKNGRSVTLEEIAVHEIRGGKIVAERYYYDPALVIAAMAPEPPGSDPPLVPEPAWPMLVWPVPVCLVPVWPVPVWPVPVKVESVLLERRQQAPEMLPEPGLDQC